MHTKNLSGIDDWLKGAENLATGYGRVRTAYKNARTGTPAPRPQPQTFPFPGIEQKTLVVYLAAGAIALFAWYKLMK